MNGLSWLLYLADVSEGIRLLSTFGWIISILVLIVCGLITAFAGEPGDYDRRSKEQRESDSGAAKQWYGKVFWFFMPVIVSSLVVFTFIPQRQTFMLIAASEFGESMIETDAARAIGGEAGELAIDSLSLLRKYINDQLEPTDVPSDSKE